MQPKFYELKDGFLIRSSPKIKPGKFWVLQAKTHRYLWSNGRLACHTGEKLEGWYDSRQAAEAAIENYYERNP